jgi:hypothetical protein
MFTLASSTEMAENLQHGVSDNWRVPPPAKPEDSASANPAEELSPKDYIEARNEEAHEKRDSARDSLNGDDGEKPKAKDHKGGWQRRVDKLTARNRAI